MSRRRMLLGGKVKPLYIFEYGNSDLTDKTFAVNKGVKFKDGLLSLPYYGIASGFYAGFSIEADFTKYKSLHFQARRTKSIDSSYFLVGYGPTSTPNGKGEYTDYENPENSKKEFYDIVFDISAVKGTQYIKAYHTISDYSLDVKNIWLE